MKKQLGILEAVPSKRLFSSIVADYDMNRALCELMDNVLDIWRLEGKSHQLLVSIDLDLTQQTIRFEDNAGGVRAPDLKLLVGPGQTKIDERMEAIGFFGVGTKRALVALSQEIKITTRPKKSSVTYLIDIDDSWLQSDDWDLPYYGTESIPEGHTIVELTRLRRPLDKRTVDDLSEHLSTTYALFLTDNRLQVKVGNSILKPTDIEDWAYPPEYEPVRQQGEITTSKGDKVKVRVVAGLSCSSSAVGEYGLYMYCNDRLIARALKDTSVGFAKGQAGLPHPSVSLAKVIVYLNGPARAMPWNSSKSGINTSHPVFQALQGFLVENMKYWTSLSRRTVSEWPSKIFAHKSGEIRDEVIDSLPEVNLDYYADLPKAKHSFAEHLKESNETIISRKPWAKGHLSSVIAVEIISKKSFEEKNRICLIILDSSLEIAFKDYLVNESGIHYSDKQLLNLFSARHTVEAEVKKYVTLSKTDWKKLKHYYDLRCKLVHERASAGITDGQVADFKSTVERVLKKLFGIKFATE